MKIINTEEIRLHTLEINDSQLDIMLALFAKTPYYSYEDKYNFCLGAGYKLTKANSDDYSQLLENIKHLIKSR